MIDVISCITLEHDLCMVALAALVCVLGAVAVLHLLSRCHLTEGTARAGWCILTSIALGSAVWSTHFIAMLAYQASVPVAFDLNLTMWSLVGPMVAIAPVLYFGTNSKSRWAPLLTGSLVGLGMSATHYIGMSAYRVDGIMEWQAGYVAASVIVAMAFTAVAFEGTAHNLNSKLHWLSVAFFSGAVVGLHFTGMTAIRIIPLRLSETAMSPETFQAMAMATALGALLVTVTGLVSYLIDSRTRTENYNQLLKMATTDDLTGLPNRTAFLARMEQKLEVCERHEGLQFAVIGLDLDRFKDINDAHGHSAGDLVLKTVAQRIRSNLKGGEFIARLGGDEFAAVKPFETRADLEDFLARIEQAAIEPVQSGSYDLRIGASIGVACYPTDGTNTGELRNNADLAMYRAKSRASQSICYCDPTMDEAVRKRRELSSALRMALENEELELHYQVQTSIVTGEVRGYEALLRWAHPELGQISPAVFIPIAEENGMIIELGEWVLRKACEEAMTWVEPQRVAVNISAVQLMQVELPRIIHETLLATGLPPERLEIELTETAIFEDRERSMHVLRQIKALGVNVALDDFGTGYSSLEVLRSFPFDKIKLDRFFMSEIETSNTAKAMIRSVLALGKNLAIPVLAEGVETRSQYRILANEGFDEMQGYLLGRPSRLIQPAKLPDLEADEDEGEDTLKKRA